MTGNAGVFISHTENDRRFAEALSRALAARGFDATGLTGRLMGEADEERLREALTRAGLHVALLSDEALLSARVFFELGAAIGGGKHSVLVYLSDRAWREAPARLRRADSIQATSLRPDEVADRVVEAAQAA